MKKALGLAWGLLLWAALIVVVVWLITHCNGWEALAHTCG